MEKENKDTQFSLGTPQALPTEKDIGKCFTANVVGHQDRKCYRLKVNYEGSSFNGMIKKTQFEGDPPTGEINVKLHEISGRIYKFVLA
ncbi:MAG: hypothetical protein E7603_09775 [Ruminococcaceae bacterium]|nr:hypothetical protein [Oscillospiraceae bacterium]